MGLITINRIRRRAIGLLSACFILLVLICYWVAHIDYFYNPRIFARRDNIFLLYKRNPGIENRGATFLHYSTDGFNWSKPILIPSEIHHAELSGDLLITVRENEYSVFDLKVLLKGREDIWVRSGQLDLGWEISTIMSSGDDIRLFGLPKDARKNGNDTEIKEAILNEKGITELSGYSLSVKVDNIRVCSNFDSLWLVYNELNKSTLNLLRKSVSGSWKEKKTDEMSLGKYDCAWIGDKLHLVGTHEYSGENSNRLVHFIISSEGVIEKTELVNHGIEDNMGNLRRLGEIDLSSHDNKLYLAARFNNIIATSTWTGGKWSVFKIVNRIPFATTFVMWIWQLGVIFLCCALVWTGFRLFQAKLGRFVEPEIQEVQEYDIAVKSKRLGAFIVDFGLISVVLLLFLQPLAADHGEMTAIESIGLNYILFYNLVIFIYFFVSENWFKQTPGKKLLGIAVKTDKGMKAGWWQILLRTVFKLLWIFWPLFLIDVSVLVIDGNSRRLGDIIAGTVVVDIKKGSS